MFQIIGRLFAFAFVVFAARSLGPDDFGRYSVAVAVVLLATIISDLGVTPVLTRMVSRDPHRSDNLLSTTLLSSGALGLLGYGTAVGFAMAAYDSNTVADVAIAGLGIPAGAMSSSVLAALDGHRLLALRAAIGLGQTGTIALGGLVLVGVGAGPRGALVALAAAPWVALLIGVLVARRHRVWSGRLHPEMSASWALLRQALPLAIGAGIGALILRLDIVLISLLGQRDDVAMYDVAQRLAESVSYLGSAVCVPALVLISARLGDGRRADLHKIYSQAIRVIYLLGIPVSVVLAVAADDIVDLAFGSDYSRAAVPLAVLGAGLSVFFVMQVQVVIITAGHRVTLGLKLAGLHLGLVAALDVALIPHLGPLGAALAMVVSWLAMAIIYDRTHCRSLGLRTALPSRRMLAAGSALGAWLLVVGPVAGGYAIPMGLVIYGVALVQGGEVDCTDIRRLSVLRRRSPLGNVWGNSGPGGNTEDGRGLPVDGVAGPPVEQSAGGIDR